MLSRERERELMDRYFAQTHYVGEDDPEIPEDPDEDPDGEG